MNKNQILALRKIPKADIINTFIEYFDALQDIAYGRLNKHQAKIRAEAVLCIMDLDI